MYATESRANGRDLTVFEHFTLLDTWKFGKIYLDMKAPTKFLTLEIYEVL